MKVVNYELHTNRDGKRWICGIFESEFGSGIFKYEECLDRIKITSGRLTGNRKENEDLLEELRIYSQNAMKGGAYVDFRKAGKAGRSVEIPFI